MKPVMKSLFRRGARGFYWLADNGLCSATPLENEPPENSPEGRCNGVLKKRFRGLLKDGVLHYSPEIATKLIKSCVVLHKICTVNNLPKPEFELGDAIADYGKFENLVENQENIIINNDLIDGRALTFFWKKELFLF